MLLRGVLLENKDRSHRSASVSKVCGVIDILWLHCIVEVEVK